MSEKIGGLTGGGVDGSHSDRRRQLVILRKQQGVSRALIIYVYMCMREWYWIYTCIHMCTSSNVFQGTYTHSKSHHALCAMKPRAALICGLFTTTIPKPHAPNPVFPEAYHARKFKRIYPLGTKDESPPRTDPDPVWGFLGTKLGANDTEMMAEYAECSKASGEAQNLRHGTVFWPTA